MRSGLKSLHLYISYPTKHPVEPIDHPASQRTVTGAPSQISSSRIRVVSAKHGLHYLPRFCVATKFHHAPGLECLILDRSFIYGH